MPLEGGISVDPNTHQTVVNIVAAGNTCCNQQPGPNLAGARPGMRVLDLAAGAGGKSLALAAAMENRGEIIACVFLVELSFLGGREKLAPYDVHALVSYDAE